MDTLLGLTTRASAMIELYPEARLVHIASVIASGGLFAVRGLAVQLRAGWAMAAPLRYLSYAIDTVLLTAALTQAPRTAQNR